MEETMKQGFITTFPWLCSCFIKWEGHTVSLLLLWPPGRMWEWSCLKAPHSLFLNMTQKRLKVRRQQMVSHCLAQATGLRLEPEHPPARTDVQQHWELNLLRSWSTQRVNNRMPDSDKMLRHRWVVRLLSSTSWGNECMRRHEIGGTSSQNVSGTRHPACGFPPCTYGTESFTFFVGRGKRNVTEDS